jgi:hypothetical protein
MGRNPELPQGGLVTEPGERVEYYAVIGSGRTQANPSGLLRRRFTPEGRVDEALQLDMSWKRTSAITRWEYANLSSELVAIGEPEAMELMQRFRREWAGQG